MKIIYNNNTIFINKNNISVYHLISLCLDENIDNYYLQSINGKILEYNEIVDNKKVYYLKRRLSGGSNTLQQSGNSFVITIGSAVIYGFITIFYYKYYLNSILNPVIEELKNIKNISGGAGKNNEKNPNSPNSPNSTNSNANFGMLMKEYFKAFIYNIQDGLFTKVKCDLFPEKKETVLNNNQTGLGSILSFALFATFIFMLLVPLFINTATKTVCGKPNYSNIIFSIIFIFIPLVLAKIIPKIVNSMPRLSNYILSISNVILMAMLILYIILNKKGLSGIMIGMFPIALILFIGIKFVPVISKIIDYVSIFISNKITVTTPVPSRPDNNNKNSNTPAPECWRRYNFIYSLFEIGITTLIGWILLVIVFSAQVKKYCLV